MSNITQFMRLPGEEKVLFLKAALVLPMIRAGLRTIGMKRVQRFLARGGDAPSSSPPSCRPSPPEALPRAKAIARIVETASAHGLFRPTCLEKSLALWRLLRGEGLACDLHIGVRPDDDGLQAHAWIEFAGTVLNDNSDVREDFASFPNPV
jgi:hypothetical protein